MTLIPIIIDAICFVQGFHIIKKTLLEIKNKKKIEFFLEVQRQK